ncbi:MAG TPA: carboxypeptidase regulatory-like domain-containing protein [Chryseosolibacter sp.]|nr:carboxypeptidase regulatory-like domain-containing protein [Chryseosolibacter sp.]
MKDLLFRITALFVVPVFLFLGCNEDTVDPVFFGSIEGTVTFESSGAPAAGVKITTSPVSSTTVTDDQGYFSLTNVPTGDYTVSANLDGYKNASDKISVTKNNTTTTSLQLTPDASTPNSPAVIFPAADAENVDRSISLQWSVIEKNNEELTYDVSLYESNQSTPLINLQDHPDTVVQVDNLKFNTSYYWQVTVKNSAGVATHGELWQFKTRPFPDNRFLFASNRNGNYDLYSTNETASDLVQLTYSAKEQVYPQYSNDRSLIAYAEYTDLAYHIFYMNKDGSAPLKVTTLPIAGNHSDGRSFCWSPDNGKFLYSHYDKLYSIDRNGSNLTLIATAPAGRNFRSCDWTGAGNKIVAETVGTLPYQSEIHLIDPVNGTDDVIINDEPGTLQSPSFSIDGKYILFTDDVSDFHSPDGRQLDSHLFLYSIATGVRTDLSAGKESGTNDLNPRYSPDGASIIFDNKRNDGSGTSSIYTYEIATKKRLLLFENAVMPDWR